jgi:hypothetical protein
MPKFDDLTIERLFGADDAENEKPERFLEYFYHNKAFDSLDADLPIRILVGHKGVGKSALLKRAHLKDIADKKISFFLQPNDLEPIKERARISKTFISQIETWKHGLLVHATLKVLHLLQPKLDASLSTEIQNGSSGSVSHLLRDALEKLGKSGRSGTSVTLYVDDIDRGWSAHRDDIVNISALLNAMRDLAGQDNPIKFRIGLRSDVYFLVRTSDESTDKIERNVIWLRWTNDDILRLAAKRIETFFGEKTDDAVLAKLQQPQISQTILSKVIDPVFHGRGHWSDRPIHNVLLSLTRARPRDLVKLFQGAARRAHTRHHTIIASEDLNDSFQAYSEERLQDIVNEFRSEMPNLEKFLLHMRPTKREKRTAESYQFSTDQLVLKIEDILQHVPVSFTNGRYATPKALIQFLYKIDFITARKNTANGIERRYFDESRFLATDIVDFGFGWEIHPAYRWALQPQDINDVIDSLGR